MLQPLDPAFVTLLAELGHRVADARLIEELPPGGTFELRTLSGRKLVPSRLQPRDQA